jgi:hypothetical protein
MHCLVLLIRSRGGGGGVACAKKKIERDGWVGSNTYEKEYRGSILILM